MLLRLGVVHYIYPTRSNSEQVANREVIVAHKMCLDTCVKGVWLVIYLRFRAILCKLVLLTFVVKFCIVQLKEIGDQALCSSYSNGYETSL